ncbi:S-adenosyl-L-methionine-dependent methyltransferase [Protomyces lactucae-debilis]|uniref:sphingolipid C(9)-methyltransferase n=1 Tax=Protomyces lactucae-debilis TaxID=2754530 RepID=A0A1Y2FF10_PROLT|nr:S-adenosyl-L-methionine-dependent methyltransferase [Protomyces lactucae-debilis]ORY82501.1 S-adenosyl-L-methionine-dependent methyltransferase [Protomyces lactucae-debilis]
MEPGFVFAETPEQAKQGPVEECGVRTTNYPTIKNAPLPADASGSHTFNNYLMFAILLGVPYYLKYKLGGGKYTWLFFIVLLFLPLLTGFWYLNSVLGGRLNSKAKYPGKPIDTYIKFKNPELAQKYAGSKIPLETFQELYIAGEVDFKGDALDVMEFRHDWSSFHFTLSLFRFFLFGMIPELLWHSRSQDEDQIRDNYDRGDDFYGFFLGPRMVYTSGLIGDIEKEESLEEMQDNKMRVICEKIGLKKGDNMLDIGCGWGTLSAFASQNYGAKVTGATLARTQTKWGNAALKELGCTDSRILCMDYRDIPKPTGGYDKITCVEMAEHVGIRRFPSFLNQIKDTLQDDGIFYMQVAGLRKCWQYEDLIWGLFMNKYIFPGADASTPLAWYISQLESAGFEVESVDNVGVHYSATLWRWYRNWLANKDKVLAKYGDRWYRMWVLFLAWSVIVSRQGGATCWQIVARKNINSFHRIERQPVQYGLKMKSSVEEKWSGFPYAKK